MPSVTAGAGLTCDQTQASAQAVADQKKRKRKEKEQTTPFDINSTSCQLSYQAAQGTADAE